MTTSIAEPSLQSAWRELGPEWDAAWDEFAGRRSAAGFMQSSAWQRFKGAEGYESCRFGLFDTERLIGGATLFSFPSDQRHRFVVCPEGPVLPWDDPLAARSGLKGLVSLTQDRISDAVGLRIEPHLAPARPSLLRNWSRAPVDLTPVHTLMIDISLTNEDLLARMQPKGRYNLRLAERHGVTVRVSADLADMPLFYGLFAETAERNGFFYEPYGYFLNLGAELFPTGMAALLIAEHQGDALAAILVVFFGRRATYLYGGSSTLRREVMPNYALHWAAIQEARRRGCEEYDLYGYDPFGIPDHQYAGISRFKKQLGAERRDWIGAWDCLFYDRLADLVIEQLPKSDMERVRA